jgi:hypothetical protein
MTIRKINRRREQSARVDLYRRRAWEGGMSQDGQRLRLDRIRRFRDGEAAEDLIHFGEMKVGTYRDS